MKMHTVAAILAAGLLACACTPQPKPTPGPAVTDDPPSKEDIRKECPRADGLPCQ